jgi:hypothetical protein
MADEVERSLSCNYPALERAGDIVHIVQWGVANLPLQTLIKRAELADSEAQ